MANKETYLKYTYGNVGTTIRPSTRLGLGTLPSTYPGASHKISPSPPWASGMPPPFTIPPCFSLPPFGQGRSSLHKRPSRITCTNAEWRGDPSRLRADERPCSPCGWGCSTLGARLIDPPLLAYST